MSAAPKYPVEFGYGGLRMTADEYLALGETHERYELIDGLVIMSPSPTTRHQKVLRLLLREMELIADRMPGLEIIPDVDVRLDSKKVYRPDLSVYAPGRLSGLPEKLNTPPDLVIEILSPGSEPTDYITKRDDYERFGVGEYWVVDPRPVNARVWRRSGVRLLEAGGESETIACLSIPGLHVDLNKVRAFLEPI